MNLFKIKFLLFYSFLWLVSQSCFAKDNWFRFKKNDLMGFKDYSGKIIVPAKYIMALPPVDGIAAVIDENRQWIYINKKGERLMKPFIYDNEPDPFIEGLSRYVYNNKVGFINKHGKIIIKARFDFAGQFQNGYAIYCINCKSIPIGDYHILKGGNWGCIDHKNHDVALSNCRASFKYMNQ